MLALRLALLLSPILLAAAPAAAQPSPDDSEARSLYEAGVRAFESGRYDRALEHFQHAYELSPRPRLLYNIGQAADRLRRDREALDAFERYLASGEVDAALRPQIESRIEVLRAEVARETPAPAAPDAAAPDAAAPDDAPATAAPVAPIASPPPDTTAGIAVLITGAALAAGGGAMLGAAAAENDAVQSAPPGASYPDYAGRLDAANGLVVGGAVALGVGAVLATVGGVMIATAGPGSVEVAVGPGSVSLRGTF